MVHSLSTDTSSRPSSPRKRGSKARGGCAFILLLAVVLIALYLYRNRTPHFDLPAPAMPATNAYPDFVRAGQLAQRLRRKSPYDLQLKHRDRVLTPAYLSAFQQDAAPILAAVQRGLNKPYRAPVDRSADPGLLVNNTLFLKCERVIAGDAITYERSGQPGKAMDTLLDGLEMAVTIPHGGGLLPFLAGNACEILCTDQIEPLLPRLSPSELAQAASRLDRITAKRAAFADVLTEEADLTTARQVAFLQDCQGVKIYDIARALVGVPRMHAPTWGQWRQITGFCLADKPAMVQANRDYLLALAAEARRPYTGPSSLHPPDNLLSPTADTLQTDRNRYVHSEAVCAILRAEIALYRYHAAHGRYPDSLAQLVPAYLPSVPDDPFGGGPGIPLRYHSAGDGRSFRLYSLGAGRQDQGGRFTPDGDEDDPGNIVAGHLWRRPTLGIGKAED